MNRTLPVFEQRILLFSIFVLSLCGIIYELVLGSLATYLLGNPVQQYSITIGFFLSSMGLGSYLSRYIVDHVEKKFITIEIFLGLTGGVSVIALNYLFSFSSSYYLLHVFFLLVVGILVGLEIPLLTRILRRYGSFRDVISNVLTFDYVGGLAGSLLFPLVLFPFVGRLLTSLIVGIVNILVAAFLILRLDYEGRRKSDILFPLLSVVLLVFLAFFSEELSRVFQKKLYYDDIVFSRRSRYQEIVLTRNEDDFRLYLDGSIQFSTFDEYRYHEMLVFPALYLNGRRDKDVLVLGGGDGIAVREILKCAAVRHVTLVELDPLMISLARNNSSMRKINGGSLGDGRVSVVVGDAYQFLAGNKKTYDVIIADFPDPHDETIAKLYTVEFFGLLKKSLAREGVFVTQSTSPLAAKEAFWCIHNTLRKAFPSVVPYHVYVPTFGDWGYNLASMGRINPEDIPAESAGRRYFSRDTFLQSLHFPKDCGRLETKLNTFNRPALYAYYLKGWRYSEF